MVKVVTPAERTQLSLEFLRTPRLILGVTHGHSPRPLEKELHPVLSDLDACGPQQAPLR